MTNIFLQQPNLVTNATTIRKVRQLSEERVALVFDRNIVRPAGGGQPQDHATVTIGDRTSDAGHVFKSDGETWVTLSSREKISPVVGELANVEVDASRRLRLSQCHTLSHLLMAAARHVVVDFVSKGMEIEEDSRHVSIRFRTHKKIGKELVDLIDCLTRHFIAKNAPVTYASLKSVQAGGLRFPKWRTDSELCLSGRIRVVDIAGIDANPCSGSHVSSTQEVGAFAVTGAFTDANGIMTLNAELCSTWRYWFGDGCLNNTAVDMTSFEA